MRWLYIFITFWLLVLIVGLALWALQPSPVTRAHLGVSFTKSQASNLGLDWREVYLAILDDLQVRNLRLQANWNEIEPERGEFNFSDIDWQLQEASKRSASVTLAVGRKLPRWPECHEPEWVKQLAPWEEEEQVLKMLKASVEHFKDQTVIKRWQLENEPLFAFGDCPKPSKSFLKKEHQLLKSLDSRLILITDSGELSSWWETAALADVQGVTLYQITWNPAFGYWHYLVPRWFYRLKAALISPAVDYTIISELQMEPWGPEALDAISLKVARESFDAKKFRDNIEFFRGTKLPEAYLWGVEWWYKAKTMGDDSLWLEAKQLWRS
ncbi:MAG: hypothetical protein ABIJ81_00905 [Patescibacteria group bacterium]